MQMSNEQQTPKPFAPHPGKIVHRYAWNGKENIVDAEGVPDDVKFIYYDSTGHQTNNKSSAAYRVPVIQTDIVSLDMSGKPVDPQHAVTFFMTDYGPGHRELRHTTASAPGR